MRVQWLSVGAVVALGAGCTTDQPAPTGTEIRVPLFVVTPADAHNLGTHLTGDEEVPPRETQAQGQAIFRISEDGSSVDFRLIATNIYNVRQAHIHCGARGTNGPVRMWLYPVIGPSGTALPTADGRQNGVLSEGTFVPGNVTCPSGQGLVAAMRDGLTYVNVHTDDGVPPANTGAGDFPGGEIRGQLGDENR